LNSFSAELKLSPTPNMLNKRYCTFHSVSLDSIKQNLCTFLL